MAEIDFRYLKLERLLFQKENPNSVMIVSVTGVS